MLRPLALTVTATLALAASASAQITYTGPGGPIANFAGFDYAPGNTLNVGGNQAAQNAFTASGGNINVVLPSQSQFMFTSFTQATVPSVLVSGGGSAVNLPNGSDFTAVIGLTERVVSAGGVAATNGQAVFAFVTPAQYAAAGSATANGATSYVNYFEIWQGGTTANNLTGQGFNGAGGANLVLSGTITSLTQTSAFNSTPGGGALDQFSGDNYGGITTNTNNGSFTVGGTVGYSNPAYFNQNLAGGSFNLTTNIAAPFNQVDPSAAFLTGSTNTGGAGVAPAAGVGLPGNTGTSIGTLNGGPLPNPGGQSAQVQNDASVTFSITPTQQVPEPASMAVFGLIAGVGGLVYRNRRNAKAAA